MTTDQKETIHKMRLEGRSYLQIAVALCISENTIKSYCRRNNLAALIKCPVINSLPDTDINPTTVCKCCGKVLTQGTKGQPKKFCSEKCRRLWWNGNTIQSDRKAWYTLTCSMCGTEFKSYGNQNRKFCSHACYIRKRFEKGV